MLPAHLASSNEYTADSGRPTPRRPALLIRLVVDSRHHLPDALKDDTVLGNMQQRRFNSLLDVLTVSTSVSQSVNDLYRANFW